jgi:hypothetical protein
VGESHPNAFSRNEIDLKRPGIVNLPDEIVITGTSRIADMIGISELGKTCP